MARENGRLGPEARSYVVDRIRKDNAKRAGSQAEHDKRISPPLSVDAPQLVDEVLEEPRIFKRRSRSGYMPNGSDIRALHDEVKLRRENLLGEVIENANIANVNANKVNDGTLADARLSNNIARKNDIISKAKDLGWGDGASFIPDGALAKSYALKSDIPNTGNLATKRKVKSLEKRIEKLEKKK